MLFEQTTDDLMRVGLRPPVRLAVTLIDGFAHDVRQRDALLAERTGFSQTISVEPDVDQARFHRVKIPDLYTSVGRGSSEVGVRGTDVEAGQSPAPAVSSRIATIEKRVNLALGVFLRVPVALLHPAIQLLGIALDHIEVVISELVPLRLHLALDLHPLAFEHVGVHVIPPRATPSAELSAVRRINSARRALQKRTAKQVTSAVNDWWP